MKARTTLMGTAALFATLLVPVAQAGQGPRDAHDRQAPAVTAVQDAHDRIVPSGDGWSASGTRGADVVAPTAGSYQDHPGAVLQPPVASPSPGGFDWGDAFIGAVGGLGSALLLVGLLVLALNQRTRTRVAVR